MARSMVPSPPRLTIRSDCWARSSAVTSSTWLGTRSASPSSASTVTPRPLAQLRMVSMALSQLRPGCSTRPTVLTMPTGPSPQLVM